MKLREIIRTENKELNEFASIPLVGAVMFFVTGYYLYDAVSSSYVKITDAQSKFEQKRMTLAQRDKIIEHELAQCSLEIASILIGNKLIGSLGALGGAIANAFGKGWFIQELGAFATAYGQKKFMEWASTDQVRKVISDFLTGQIFTHLKIIGNAGPMYEKYVGSKLKAALEDAEKSIVDSAKKTTGLNSNEPAKTATSTARPAANIPPPLGPPSETPSNAYTKFGQTEYDPTDPDNPYRVNVQYR